MRVIIYTFLFLFLAISVAFAQESDSDANLRFYNFDEILITGEHKKPKILYIDIRKKVKFKRLLRMRKSMLPKLLGTGKEPTLR
tara:strand:- start:296 stop:547 length:252 start_codon:yes stop_codon:yes gene_type:complete